MKLKDVFKAFIVTNDIEDAFTGMALGVDTVFALAVLELKDEGYAICLHAVIPCCMQYCKWVPESVEMRNERKRNQSSGMGYRKHPSGSRTQQHRSKIT